MKTAKNAALGVLAATVMSFVTPLTSASAGQGDTLTGGCGFDTNQQSTVTGGLNEGVIYVTAVSQHASGMPSTATVDCWIDVNGVEQPGTRLSRTGTGVIAGSAQISYSSLDGDSVVQCQRVVFADGSTWTAKDGNVGVDCPPLTEISFPPEFDPLQFALYTLNSLLIQYADPAVCPVLAAHAGNYGPIVIDSTGDTWVSDPLGLVGKVYDCPPYDVF